MTSYERMNLPSQPTSMPMPEQGMRMPMNKSMEEMPARMEGASPRRKVMSYMDKLQQRWEDQIAPAKATPWYWIIAALVWIGVFFAVAWLLKLLWNGAVRKHLTVGAHVQTIWPSVGFLTSLLLIGLLFQR